jgi:GNAT superfamily N-acetyltransferase
MNTHYLGLEEVRAYCADLIKRLKSLAPNIPRLWCPIGESGRTLAERLLMDAPDIVPEIGLVEAEYERDANRVSFRNGSTADDFHGQRVLVLDSSVHSGRTMSKVVSEVIAAKASAVCTYALVVKRSAAFVPSFWGVSIEDHDRAYFLLNELPNNRLNPRDPYIHIRRLSQNDIKAPAVVSGLESLDRFTWADRYYDMETRGGSHITYVLEAGATIIGYLTFTFRDSSTMDLDEVAVDRQHQGKGYSSALMRWAETSARQARVQAMRLWGIADQVPKYEHLGYRKEHDRKMTLDDGTYYFMSKRVMYHI